MKNWWDEAPLAKQSTGGNWWDEAPLRDAPAAEKSDGGGVLDTLADTGRGLIAGAVKHLVGNPAAAIGDAFFPDQETMQRSADALREKYPELAPAIREKAPVGPGDRARQLTADIEAKLQGYDSQAIEDARTRVGEKVGALQDEGALTRMFGTAGAYLSEPRALLDAVAQSLPSMVPAIGATKFLSLKMLAEEGLKPGTRAAAEFLARKDVTAKLLTAAATAEGSVAGLDVYNQAVSEGADKQDAALSGWGAGLGTATIGRLAGKILPDVETTAGKVLAGGGTGAGSVLAAGKNIARSMFSEGVLQELPQSMQEQVFTNLATGKPWNEGVMEAGGAGMVTGAGMGGTVQTGAEVLSATRAPRTGDKTVDSFLDQMDVESEALQRELDISFAERNQRIIDQQFGPVQGPQPLADYPRPPAQTAEQRNQGLIDQLMGAETFSPEEQKADAFRQAELEQIRQRRLEEGVARLQDKFERGVTPAQAPPAPVPVEPVAEGAPAPLPYEEETAARYPYGIDGQPVMSRRGNEQAPNQGSLLDVTTPEGRADVDQVRRVVSGYLGEDLPEGSFDLGQVNERETAGLREVADLFGKKVVVVRDNRPAESKARLEFNGVALLPDTSTVYVSEDSNRAVMAVTGHEITHVLRQEAPDIYDDLVSELSSELDAKAFDGYAQRINANRTREGQEAMPLGEIMEEVVADGMGDRFTEPKFWQQVAEKLEGKEPGLAQRVMTRLVSLVDQVLNRFRAKGLNSEQYFRDINRVRMAMSTAAARYADRTRGGADQAGAPTDPRFSPAWHGSPHDFDKFTTGAIGTGEGAQAFGHGLYFAEDRGVAEGYRKNLSQNARPNAYDGQSLTEGQSRAVDRMTRVGLEQTIVTLERSIEAAKAGKPYTTESVESLQEGLDYARSLKSFDPEKVTKGRLYQVELAPAEDEYLDWDKPLSQQSDKVREALDKVGIRPGKARQGTREVYADGTGAEVYQRLVDQRNGDDRAVSQYLREQGIRGIKYKDAASRNGGRRNIPPLFSLKISTPKDPTYNRVIFDENDVEVTAKFSRTKKLTPEASAQLDGLYEEADQLMPEFKRLYDELAARVPGSYPAVAPVKGRERAEEKILEDYDGDPTQIKDLLRGALIIPDLESGQATIAAIEEIFETVGRPRLTLVEGGSSDGYVDIKYNVRINDHVGEVQANVASMIVAKELFGHGFYEIARSTPVTLENQPKHAALTAAQKAIYGRARELVGAPLKSIEQRLRVLSSGQERKVNRQYGFSITSKKSTLETKVPFLKADVYRKGLGGSRSYAQAKNVALSTTTGTPSTSYNANRSSEESGKSSMAGGLGSDGIGITSTRSVSQAGLDKTKFARRASPRVEPDATPITDVAEQQRVSTRRPTAVGSPENPITEMLSARYVAFRRVPDLVRKAALAIAQYPQVRIGRASKPETILDKAIEQFRDNLLWLYGKVDPAIRERSKLWYDGANRIANRMAQRYRVTPRQAAGVLATQSPQKDWFENVSLGERIIDTWQNYQDHAWDSRMDKVLNRVVGAEALAEVVGEDVVEGTRSEIVLKLAQKKMASSKKSMTLAEAREAIEATITKKQAAAERLAKAVRGKRLSDIWDDEHRAVWIRVFDAAHNSPHYHVVSPEGDFVGVREGKTGSPASIRWGTFSAIAKSVSILRDGSFENISDQLGDMHKIRNFYNNIIDPNATEQDVTIDTHAIAADMVSPFAGTSVPVAHNFGSTGKSAVYGLSGTYPVHLEAYQQAAEQAELLGREMQSITWEAVRGLFTAPFKSKVTNTRAVNEIWERYAAGEITQDEARNEILGYVLKTTGRTEAEVFTPEWASSPYQAQSETSFEKKAPVPPAPRQPRTDAGINAEVAPNPDSIKRGGALLRMWSELPEAEQAKVTQNVAGPVIKAMMRKLGIKAYDVEYTLGGFEGETNPSVIVHFGPDVDYDAKLEAAKVLGVLWHQKAMIAYDENDTADGTQFVKVTPDRELSYNDKRDLFIEINKRYPAAAGVTARDGSLVFGNFEGLPEQEFHDGIDAAIAEIDVDYGIKTEDAVFRSDWIEPVNLEGTRYGEGDTSAEGDKRNVSRWERDFGAIQSDSDARFKREVQWAHERSRPGSGDPGVRGAAPEPVFSRRPDAASSGRSGAPSYGTGIEGAVSVEGTHYSRERRGELDSSYYGTGMRGAERRRLDRPSADPAVRNRVFFYVDEGAGVTPESAVGAYPHRVRLENLYDWTEDALRLWPAAAAVHTDHSDRVNHVEAAVVGAGFDGYYARGAFDGQGVAVLLGDHVVPVESGQGTATQPAPVQTEPTLADRIAQSRLPAGALLGRDWLRRLEQTDMLTPNLRAALEQRTGERIYRSDLAGLATEPRFSRRTRPDPQKTIIAYKLVKMKRTRPGKVFPLYVDANEEMPFGVWLDADIGDAGKPTKTGQARVKSKIGDLSMRPGWHMGDTPMASHIGGKANPTDKAPSVREPDTAWVEVEVAADVDWQTEANRRARPFKTTNPKTGAVKGEPNPGTAEIKDQIPTDGYYRYKTNPNMTGNWIIAGAIRLRRVLSDEAAARINEAAGVEDLPRREPLDLEAFGLDTEPRFSRKQTETAEFKRWFGDSKVVDENGQPLVVYHGTRADFSEFDTDYTRDLGIHLGTQKQANHFAQRGGGRVIPAYVSIKNPITLSDTFDAKTTAAQDTIWQLESKKVLPKSETMSLRALSISNHDYGDEGIQSTWAAIREALENAGYDGVVYFNENEKEGRGTSYIAFRPEQIKSAVGNRGTFDPTNPDIRFSRRKYAPGTTQAQKAFLDKIGPTVTQTLRQRWDGFTERLGARIKQGVIDKYAALLDVDKQLFGNDVLKGPTIASSGYALARMAESGGGALTAMLRAGRIFYDPQNKVIDVDTSKPGLMEVLARLGSPEEIDRFLGWVAANRAQELKAQGRENLFTDQDIQAGLTLNRGQNANDDDRAVLFPKVKKAFDAFKNDVLDIASTAGILDPVWAAAWKDDWYVPFYRIMDDDEIAGPRMGGASLKPKEAFKKLKGGTEQLNDLLENTLMNFHHLLAQSLKNIATRQALENAAQLGVASKTAEPIRNKKASTYHFKNGGKVWYNVDDPLVFNSLTMITTSGMNGTAMRALRGFKRLFTNFVTASPQFIIRNLIRDALHSIAVAPEMSTNAPKNVVKGIASYGFGDNMTEVRSHMLSTGAAFSFGHIYGEHIDDLKYQIGRQKRSVVRVRSPESILDALLTTGKVARRAWEKYHAISDSAENANRAALYDQVLTAEGNKLRAAYESRNLLDFGKHGAWPAVRFLTETVPFLNARLQGLARMGEPFNSPKGRKRLAIVIGAMAMATMALRFANDDDDEYRRLEDWEKDGSWHIFPGTFGEEGDWHVIIPKPFEVGAIATLAERMFEQAIDDEATGKDFRKSIAHMLTETFSFNPVPQALAPIFDVIANKDSFTGRDIENMSMERLSPVLRKRASTTSVATGISEALDATVGKVSQKAVLSPVQVDYLINNYLGWVGSASVGMLSGIYDGWDGKEKPKKYWFEYQPLRSFYRDEKLPGYTRHMTEFYELYREANTLAADRRKFEMHGEEDLIAKLESDPKKLTKLQLQKVLSRAARKISAINRELEVLDRDRTVPADEKRRRVDELRKIKNVLAEDVMRAAKDRLR